MSSHRAFRPNLPERRGPASPARSITHPIRRVRSPHPPTRRVELRVARRLTSGRSPWTLAVMMKTRLLAAGALALGLVVSSSAAFAQDPPPPVTDARMHL